MSAPKFFRVTPGGRAKIAATMESIRMTVDGQDGSPGPGVSVTQAGTVIDGPMSVMSMALEQKTAAIFSPLPHFAMMIPPTIVTPLPKHIPIPPLAGIAGVLAFNSFMMSLLA